MQLPGRQDQERPSEVESDAYLNLVHQLMALPECYRKFEDVTREVMSIMPEPGTGGR